MGRIFLDHIGGTRLFSYANCDTILTNRSELISTRFTGTTGRAFLFNKVVNLQYSEVQDQVMLTGCHMVQDVSWKNCNSKLGWIYEFATEDSQQYKEGHVIQKHAVVRVRALESMYHLIILEEKEINPSFPRSPSLKTKIYLHTLSP
ncbi:Protein yippee-like 5 [Heterocephalus glaber]|uniref:Protein yippee-like n=1 Tax=Heterocephalus glaber TaxID=10181 RepID=G5C783_HETGA|nr:Protein yippee-like 5 [Heterocephalus glaber]